MRRWLVAFLLGAILGGMGGVAFGFFVFPYVFPPPAGTDQLSEAEARVPVVAEGRFIHADPSDRVHYGEGMVTVRQNTVFLGPDFKVGPGPAFHVYLVPKAKIRVSADLDGQMYVDLGPLRAFEGSQKYVIPPGIDLANYSSVVIWCERFSVLISPADLEKPARPAS